MPNFSDLLNDKTKKKLILPSINKGDIFRMKMTEAEGITPKNNKDDFRYKYFVVVGRTEDDNLIGFVVINSEINKFLSQKIKMLHYPISKKDYPFLDHDSFIHCGELKEIAIDMFLERYNTGTHGSLSESDMNIVIESLLESPTETAKHLKKFNIKK